MTIKHVSVVIPARNERRLVERCLASVIDAAHRLTIGASVVLVDDGSSDHTADVAEAVLAGFPSVVLRVDESNVGAARTAGVNHAISGLAGVDPADLWLAFTDADTSVPALWLRRQLHHANDGVDGVAGMVSLDSTRPALVKSFRDSYMRDVRTDTHPHIHGANLGVRASSYLAVGGFVPLRCGEDRDLWFRLVARGHRLVNDPQLLVTTSARLKSRTRGGFATDLRNLERSMIAEGLAPT